MSPRSRSPRRLALLPRSPRMLGLARLAALGLLLAACKIAPSAKRDVAFDGEVDEKTASQIAVELSFDKGQLVNGAPPAAKGTGGPEVRRVTDPPTLTPGLKANLAIWVSGLPTQGSFTVHVAIAGAAKYTSITVDSSETGGKTSGTLTLPFEVSRKACDGLGHDLFTGTVSVSAAHGADQVSAPIAAPFSLDCRSSGEATAGSGAGPGGDGCQSLKTCSKGGSLRACSSGGTCWYEVAGQRLDCGACDGPTLALCAQIASADCNGP